MYEVTNERMNCSVFSSALICFPVNYNLSQHELPAVPMSSQSRGQEQEAVTKRRSPSMTVQLHNRAGGLKVVDSQHKSLLFS